MVLVRREEGKRKKRHTAEEKEALPKRVPTRPRMMMAQMPCRPARVRAMMEEKENLRVRGAGPSILSCGLGCFLRGSEGEVYCV